MTYTQFYDKRSGNIIARASDQGETAQVAVCNKHGDHAAILHNRLNAKLEGGEDYYNEILQCGHYKSGKNIDPDGVFCDDILE